MPLSCNMNIRKIIHACLLAAPLVSIAEPKPHYKVHVLEIEGHSDGEAFDLNESGSAVARHARDGHTWPFIWKLDADGNYAGTRIDLPFKGYKNLYYTRDNLVINDQDQVAGNFHKTGSYTANGQTKSGSWSMPFTWDPSVGGDAWYYDGFSDVNSVNVKDISNSGKLIGSTYGQTFSWDIEQTNYTSLFNISGYRGYMVSSNGKGGAVAGLNKTGPYEPYSQRTAYSTDWGQFQRLDIGLSPPDHVRNYFTSINDLGEITGYSWLRRTDGGAGDYQVGWFWAPGMDDAVALDPMTRPDATGQNLYSRTVKINDNAVVIGYTSGYNFSLGHIPFVWNLDGDSETQGLKSVYDGVDDWEVADLEVADINNADQIIGYGSLPDGYDFAAFWEAGESYDLNHVAAPEMGRVIVEAVKITDSGFILAKGFHKGRYASFVLEPVADDDGDGLPSYWESQYGLNPNDPSDAESDTDNDGLSALDEYLYDTDPTLRDTDGDTMTDGFEVANFLDPLNPEDKSSDYNGNGLTAYLEYFGNNNWGLNLSSLPEYEPPIDLGDYTGQLIKPNDLNERQEIVGGYGYESGPSYARAFESSPFYWSDLVGAIEPLEKGGDDYKRAQALVVSETGRIAGESHYSYTYPDEDDGRMRTGYDRKAATWAQHYADVELHEVDAAGEAITDDGRVLAPELFLRYTSGYSRGYDVFELDNGLVSFGYSLTTIPYRFPDLVFNKYGESFVANATTRHYNWDESEYPFELMYFDKLGDLVTTIPVSAEMDAWNTFYLNAANRTGDVIGQLDGKPFWFVDGRLQYIEASGSSGYGDPIDLNDYSVIVGSSESGGGYVTATLWLGDEAPALDMNYLIPEDSGWDLVAATAINNRGDVAGYGYRDGVDHQYRAYLAKIKPTDADGDGLPDDYETFWGHLFSNIFGTGSSDLDVYEDYDGDLLSTYVEFLLGTYLHIANRDDEEAVRTAKASSLDADVIIVVGNEVMEVKELSAASRLRSNYHR